MRQEVKSEVRGLRQKLFTDIYGLLTDIHVASQTRRKENVKLKSEDVFVKQ